ncbi:hypothetical protein B0H11DRAFT_2029370, partial [Mycena galericulata]
GGKGGLGGEGYGQGTGGHGGDGQGPTVHLHIKTSELTVDSLRARTAQASEIVNHCPPASRIFHGRQDILDKMHHFFTSNMGTQHIYVLHGLGGAGKTQIAL